MHRVGVLVSLLWITLWSSIPSVSEAHTERRSYSSWQWDAQSALVSFRFDQRNLAEYIVGPGLESGYVGRRELEQLRLLPAQLVTSGLKVTQGGKPCSIVLNTDKALQKDRWLVIRGEVKCPKPVQTDEVIVEIDLMGGASLDHAHFMRVSSGEQERQIAFGIGNKRWSSGEMVGAASPALATALSMMQQGIIHLVFGYDHMAFLLTLILVSWFLRTDPKGLRGELFAIAIAFTLGHSLTLSLAVTGAVMVSEPAVEFLIALSVAGLAWDGLLRSRPDSLVLRYGGALLLLLISVLSVFGVADHAAVSVMGLCVFLACYAAQAHPGPWMRASVAAAFGLLHGFGFAGALKEIGGASSHVVLSLAAFNIGVEIGQWLVIGAILVMLWLLRAREYSRAWLEASCALSLWLGVYWTVARFV